MTRLLADDGRVHGVVAIELATGKIQAITAKAVVLATGGGGKVFPFTTNANINTGDGMALAYRAGLRSRTWSSCSTTRPGLPFTGILITEATRAEGGWLLNKDGYRYLQDYDLGTPTRHADAAQHGARPARPALPGLRARGARRGGPTDSPYGPVVYLDLRHLGEKLIEAKLPMVRELCLQYERIDPVTELIPVRPVVHYMMGGVHTDIDGKAGLDGLYAAGETACVSINGANRLGLELAARVPGVRGPRGPGRRRVRRHRAGAARRDRGPGRRRGTSPRGSCSTGTPGSEDGTARIRDELQATHGGRRRHLPDGTLDGEGARHRSARCGSARTRSGSATPAGPSTPSWSAPWSWRTWSTSGECILRSGLAREESRGAHQRTDFTARDDERFLAHHLVRRDDDGTARVEQLPVTITRWPPGERVYGR